MQIIKSITLDNGFTFTAVKLADNYYAVELDGDYYAGAFSTERRAMNALKSALECHNAAHLL